jgi:hypothetical protein
MRQLPVLALALILVACTGAASPTASVLPAPTPSPIIIYVTPPPTPVISAPPTLVPTPTAEPTSEPTNAGQTLEPTPTAVPTETTSTTTPPVAASVVITQQYMKPYSDGYGGLNYEVIVEVHNEGGTAADISGGSNDYTIYYKDGSVLTTGTFTYPFPQTIPSNEYGYFVDSGSFDKGTKLSDIGKVDSSLQYGDPVCDASMLSVSKVRVTPESYGSGLNATGVVTNNGATDASDVIVGFIFFDSAGSPIGALYDNNAGALSAGKSKGSSTSYPGTPPLKPSAVKSYKAFAYDFQYSC